MRIGLIGENPNDTESIANLLRLKYNHQYISVLKRRKGGQLDNNKFTSLLEIELRNNNFDLLIFVRDLDGFENEPDKVAVREKWFTINKAHFQKDSLFLLNIQTLEAIFFSDIVSLNKVFNLKVSFKNPITISNPKKELMKITSDRYKENRAADYISKLNYDSVLKNYKPLKEIDDYLTQ